MTHTSAKQPAQAAKRAVELCLNEGFALAGVGPALPSETGRALDAWLAAGKHGSMGYLARTAATRKNALLELPEAHSVVMVGLQYSDGSPDDTPAAPFGRIARYARGEDYHDTIKARLTRVTARLLSEYPGAKFRKFTDTSPFMEREHAARAGLGWVGKHTLVIHPRQGSYFALGGFLTSIAMESSARIDDSCGTCTRCIDACPTAAITPYSVDGSRCIAYLTIESRTPPPAHLQQATRGWVFGCDICQEVCPHNSPRVGAHRQVDSSINERLQGVPLLELLGWSPNDRAQELRATPLKRARLDMLKRNALYGLGNWLRDHEDPAAWERIKAIAADECAEPMVRDAARDVLTWRGPSAC